MFTKKRNRMEVTRRIDEKRKIQIGEKIGLPQFNNHMQHNELKIKHLMLVFFECVPFWLSQRNG